MRPAVVGCDDLNVLVIPAPVWFLILDPHVREVEFLVEVRQIVFVRPFANLRVCSIGVPVVVVVVLVALVEPPLIIALELVVQDDPLDVDVAFEQAGLRVLVRAIDLEVVLQLPSARQARVERLVRLVVAVAMVLEEAATVLRQDHRRLAVPRNSNGLDESTFAKVTEVAVPGIARAIVVVAKVTTGDHSKGADGCQGAGLGAA
jgi:hypothetical protein